jgi:2-polyprenyl-3-methyl-5-hydroxy-6-metoxy-1,4-benzoquinol methylase
MNEWDEYANQWDGDERVIRYSQQAYQSLTQAINCDGLTILDFGCGTGRLTELLHPHAKRIVAIDSSAKMIGVLAAKNLPKAEPRAIDLNSSNSQPMHNRFDLIVASSVCAFLPDYHSSLALFKQLLKPQGYFVQWDWLKEAGESTPGFTMEEIQAAFDNCSFETINLQQAFTMQQGEDEAPVIMGIAQKRDQTG